MLDQFINNKIIYTSQLHNKLTTNYINFHLSLYIYIYIYILWGQRICDPGPLYIRAQVSRRGNALSRTCNENPNGLEI